MNVYPPAERPTLYFIGVSTGQSSIMRIFPRWAEALSLGECDIRGIDFALHDRPAAYREAVGFIKQDRLSRGALVTTHKIDLLAASADLFDELDPFASAQREVSCLSKREGRLIGHAKDPVSSALALQALVPQGHWARTGGEVLVLGAGGATTAITWNLTEPGRGADRPSRIVVSDILPERLEALHRFHRGLGHTIPVETAVSTGAAQSDALLAGLPPGSLVINATGLGKDRPGSPLSDSARFPQDGLAWDLNYRGDLLFLGQAEAQANAGARGLRVADGLELLPAWLDAGDRRGVRRRNPFLRAGLRASVGARRRSAAATMTSLPRILVTPRSLTRAPDPALSRLQQAGYEIVLCTAGATPDEAELLRLLPGCVGWIAGVEPVSPRVLHAASGLRAISRNGAGVDNLPLATAEALGIAVLRAGGANARGVAELAIGLMLASLRALPALSEVVRQGGWQRRIGGEVGARAVGVVGCGAVGQRVVRAALGLGATVLGFDPYPSAALQPLAGFAWGGLDTVLAGADIISLHCPMPANGRPLLDAARIASLRPGCHLINTARAGLVDEAALLAALETGRIGGYATDVFTVEPPELSPLLKHPNVIATPHVGGFTAESVREATAAAVENLLRALAA